MVKEQNIAIKILLGGLYSLKYKEELESLLGKSETVSWVVGLLVLMW